MADEISTLLLERYVQGSASAVEKARVEASPEAMTRVEELRRDSTALLTAHPPANVAALVRARAAAADKRTVRPFLWLAPVVAVACAVLFIAMPREDGEGIRLKGVKPHLTLYRQVGTSSEKLASGSAAHPGDTVQLAYLAGEATYGAIVSVDGRGNVTVHVPTSGDGKLSQKNEVLLPRAYTLDDAPRFERFVFVAGLKPVDVARLQKLLRATPELEAEKLREGLNAASVDVFTLRKEP
jgi:hypothetical protein